MVTGGVNALSGKQGLWVWSQVGLMHSAANRVYGCGHRVRSGGVNALSRKQSLWCGHRVRSNGVNALSRKQGLWVWSLSVKWWG